ncbi:hypothetical protein F5X99DRAFT_414337 [Biscogniauxia marginata]|nr:hypothetical protein F5X99DRAFT_414337 [Biscogniauxia marginata]
MGIRSALKKLEVKPTDDEFESIKTSRWGNKDVYPIPHDKRTYGWLAFYAYWGTCGISLSSWTIGSSLIGIGLTAGQACAVVWHSSSSCLRSLGSYFVVMLNVF